MVKYGGRSSKQIEQWAKYKAINNLDIDNNSLNNLLAILSSAQSSPPSSPSNGDYYMDDGTNTPDGFAGLRQYTNGAWEDIPSSGTGLTDEIKDSDSDTKVQTEESADEDRVRIDVAGTEKGVWGLNGLDMKNNSLDSVSSITESNSKVLQARFDGMLVPISEGKGMLDRIDPSTTSTPVQDGISVLQGVGGGTLLLPPTAVTDNGPITFTNAEKNIGIIGIFGKSEIVIGTTGTNGIVFSDASNYPQCNTLDGFTLRGQGDNSAEANAIVHGDKGAWRTHIGHLRITEWYGCPYLVQSGSLPFANRHDFLEFTSVDAGDASGLITWEGTGAPNTFGMIEAYPTPTTSGKDTNIIAQYAGTLSFKQINAGGSTGKILDDSAVTSGGLGNTYIEQVNWEANNQQTTPLDSAFEHLRNGITKIDVTRLAVGNIDYCHELGFNHANKTLGRIEDQAGINENKIKITTETNGECFYFGPSSDIDNTSGVVTDLFRSLSNKKTNYQTQVWEDEFLGAAPLSNWSQDTSGGGSFANYHGLIYVQSGATSGNSAFLNWGGNTVKQPTVNYPKKMETILRLDSTTLQLIQFGLSRYDPPFSNSADALWIEHNPGVSANFVAKQSEGGTAGVASVDTGISADTNFHLFSLEVTNTGLIVCIDGEQVADLTGDGNLPNQNLEPVFYAETNENAEKKIRMDSFKLEVPRVY